MYRLLKAGGGGGGGFWQPRPGKQIIFLPLTLSLTLYALKGVKYLRFTVPSETKCC